LNDEKYTCTTEYIHMKSFFQVKGQPESLFRSKTTRKS